MLIVRTLSQVADDAYRPAHGYYSGAFSPLQDLVRLLCCPLINTNDTQTQPTTWYFIPDLFQIKELKSKGTRNLAFE